MGANLFATALFLDKVVDLTTRHSNLRRLGVRRVWPCCKKAKRAQG